MNTLPTTTVFLTEEEAILFVKFQKHRALMGLLESIHAFDVKAGSVTIHFTKLGEIAGVDKQEHYSPR